jgi:superfamily I DNA and/or RNA helicase/very-short-patch-repair endonuclease
MEAKNLGTNGFKERAIRLLEYLREITGLRSKLIRNLQDYKSINEYDSILWINDIPKDQLHCFSRAWNYELEDDPDIWLAIKRYPEPPLGPVPTICEPWINTQTLRNIQEIPELESSIEIEESVTDPDDPNSSVIRKTEIFLRDHPEIAAEWERFIEESWFPWTAKYQLWESTQNAYRKLFSIYQLQQKLGEKYELVMGVGLLSWKLPSGHYVNRHVLTARADLQFEARLGKFTVKPALDKPDIRVELDMIDPEFQPITLRGVAQGLVFPNNDLWEREVIDLALVSLANSISNTADGLYLREEFAPNPNKSIERPEIRYSPALYLRERTERDLEQRISEILNLLDEEEKIPPEFIDLCEITPDRSAYLEAIGDSTNVDDNLVYFPKPSNEEQIQIVDKLGQTTGILVQGPPGTGKSHTIANLICHLLATGQRVLVTAKTSRALQVLHKLLPEKLQPLCVILLGSSIEEQKELETSVSHILNEQDKWNELETSQEIQANTNKLQEMKEEKARLQFRLKTIREADIKKQQIQDTPYKGTAGEIALQLRAESNKFEWLKDKISNESISPISTEDLRKLIALLKTFGPEETPDLRKTLPVTGVDIPTLEGIHDLLLKGRTLGDACRNKASLLTSPLGQSLSRASDQNIQSIQAALNELITPINELMARGIEWERDAAISILREDEGFWRGISSSLSARLQGLNQKALSISGLRIEIPSRLERKRISLDAEALKSHLDARKRLGFGPFRPKLVKSVRYVIEEIRINHHKCNTSETLGQLVDFLYVEHTLDDCWGYWQRRAYRQSEDKLIQITELEALQARLISVLAISDKIKEAKNQFHKLEQSVDVHWHDVEKLRVIIDTCEAVKDKRAYEIVKNEYRRVLAGIERLASKENSHPIFLRALELIKAGKEEEYGKLILDIQRLIARQTDLAWTEATLGIIRLSAPILSGEISKDPKDEIWPNRIDLFNEAWNWARAKSWLEDYIAKDNIPSISNRILKVDDEIRGLIESLAAKKAWRFCFSRMTETHRRNLIGWHFEMRKVGKRTGKHWPKHLKNAQKYLNESKDVVPAWVMPLHKVYENIQSAPGLFDVIIIDEASQCGPEALPLYFLGKKIIVVGDNQQISPDAIFVDQDVIDKVIRNNIDDFRFKSCFTPDYSLFDHAKLRFPSPIVLREHFRCMPEIIQFSNDLCYSDTPLIPLRQYTEKRLPPLMSIHVQEGFREGREGRAVNIPEAERLVEKLVACCQKPEYQNKSMGVITLLGNAQASVIEDLLLKNLGVEEIEERRIICGDAYSFQGDERDVIFLSMVAAPNEQIGVLNKLPDKRRLNVAASRARDQMWLFHTATRNHLSKHCFRWRLLEHFEEPRSQLLRGIGNEGEGLSLDDLKLSASQANRIIERPPAPFDSWFEVDAAIDISSHGFRVISQFDVAGKRIDLVIQGSSAQLAVECDGDEWHGIEEYEHDMERQRKLERCGWVFHRIRESAYYSNKEKALEQLWRTLKERKIGTIFEESQLPTAHSEGVQEGKRPVFKSKPKAADESRERTAESPDKSSPSVDKRKYENIDDLIRLKNERLCEITIETLKTRPNYSCKKDSLTTLILKHIGVQSRGKPRHILDLKVMRVLTQMEEDGLIKIYKSKNVRVRLVGF